MIFSVLYRMQLVGRWALAFLFLSGMNCAISYGDDVAYRKLAVYTVVPLASAAPLDGRLTEQCWDKIPSADTFYEYLKPDPKLGNLRTSYQMTYDESGIYLRMTNHEDRMDKIRSSIDKRGNPALWMDDSVEVFFDPNGNGVGYVCFTINSNAAQSDRKQLDAAVSLPGWRGDNWRTWVRKKEGAWIVDAYFPWSDLGRQAVAGDLWMFNEVRFGYSTGKFEGVSWAPGGSYMRPGYFGYLYFQKGPDPETDAIGRALQAKAIPPWMTSVNSEILRFGTGASFVRLKSDEVLDDSLVMMQAAVDRLRAFPRAHEDSLLQMKLYRQEVESVKENSHDGLEVSERIQAFTRTLQSSYWLEQIDSLLRKTSSESQ